jgi:YesN/AraC family two-component response regulator
LLNIYLYGASKPALEFQATGLSRSQLARVIDYIKTNLTQDVSILDLATLTSMSESHFSRSFKRSVGIAPYQYLMQQRVERAKQLLKQQIYKSYRFPYSRSLGLYIVSHRQHVGKGYANAGDGNDS